ncbi:hypothetical protein AQUCO_02700364v1 [Aquilegia coerulea]|uniref:DUF629 domain-containing protein n=1 Tax=Aquilegia coerulea TaxID=218851 RepID=A0A2G5D6I7_AQUCA|nr:hypothetical protein AQUCO_02700364v1 [Aquilegia coerulea]
MENKNANLALEERRKKIEANVVAARIEMAVQQDSESLQENLGTPVVQPHEGGKGKNLKHVVKREEKVHLLWNSISVDDKHNLLKLDLHDLLAHFHSPKTVNREWQSMISNGPWKAVDAPVALPILEEQWELLSSIQSKKYTTTNNMLDIKDSHTGKSLHKSTPGLYTDECHVQQMEKESKVKECSDGEGFLSPCWPIANDSDREWLLEKARLLFELLLKTDALAADHVNKVIQYTMKKLQVLYPGLRFSELGLNQTQICICFLNASQIGRVLEFLGELWQFSMKKNTGNKSETDEFLHSRILECDIRERCFLDGDLILVHKQSLRGESTLAVYTDADASATFVPDGDQRDTGPPNSDDLLRWMFTDSSSEEDLKLWSGLEKLREHQGKELHQILQKNYHTLKNLCEEKCNQLNYKEELQAIWALLFSELRERKFSTKHSPWRFATVLQKKLEELIELEKQNDVSNISKSMLSIIPDVLNNKPTLTAVATDFVDLDTFKDDDLVMQNSLDKSDTCVKEAIMRVNEHIDLELMKNDTLIMRTVEERAKLVSRINPSAAGDYRAILLPLVKSYILAKLEELAGREATEKSKVAKGELVIQIASDVKKSINKGGNQPKPTPKKSKNKTKKMAKNTMDVKV